MAYAIISNGGNVNYGIKHLTVDKEDDIFYLGATAQPGSTIYCIDTQSRYVMNTKREWVKQGGGGAVSGNDDTIYEGGDLNNEDTATPDTDDNTNDLVYEGGKP